MNSGKVQPISPAEATPSLLLPDGLVTSINQAILDNLVIIDNPVIEEKKSSTFDVHPIVNSYNVTVESSERLVLSEKLFSRIKAVYSTKGWKVTWESKQVERNEWGTEMTFLGSERAPA